MKYLINKTNHCDFKTIAVNRLDPRAYFIAHKKKSDAKKVKMQTPAPVEKVEVEEQPILSEKEEELYQEITDLTTKNIE